MVALPASSNTSFSAAGRFFKIAFFDKPAFAPRTFSAGDGVRLVPGGTSVRRGAHLARGVIVMPPALVNVGAHVGEGTMVDSHALVGSCAQVGARVHLSAGAQIGGVLEPAGALSLAGLKKYVASKPSQDTKRQLVAIASGANMNFDRLRFVAERAALGEKKEALLAVTIPERPGSFAALVAAINPMGVTEFCYRYHTGAAANIIVGVQLTAANRERDLADLISRLQKQDMQATDLSGDELAKSHIRYLVGGRSDAANERLFAFEFPERQGALHKFLTTLQPGLNISLFHYRNYGGDVAKILAGIQCPAGEVSFMHKSDECVIQCTDDQSKQEASLDKFLSELGYPWKEETENPAYKMFMRQ